MSQGISLRPSQYLYTFGVGSILESKNGPRLIIDIRNWGPIFQNKVVKYIEKYRIIEPNLERLLEDGRIFRLPTNAELGETEEQILYYTSRFPQWARCRDHNTLFRLKRDGRTSCPKCHPNKYAHTRAVRFIKACSRGHMDDIDWVYVVHRNNLGCNHDIFNWIEEGSMLQNIYVECQKCKARISLSEIYFGDHLCTGRRPEFDSSDVGCKKEAIVTLRNSSNLRVPLIDTALTIPPLDTKLSRILENPELRSTLIIANKSKWNKSQIMETLKMLTSGISGFNKISLKEINKSKEETLLETINSIIKIDESPDVYNQLDLRKKELSRLKYAADNGWPLDVNNEERDFEVIKKDVKIFKLSDNLSLRITPVNRLRVVAVQKGYRRIVGSEEPIPVLTSLKHNDKNWYIGMVLRGEGIFLDIKDIKNHKLMGDDIWREEFQKRKDMLYDSKFVWWHTLSHRLIKSLAIDSGYSSASIRERIYPGNEEEANSGGVLLYTSQRGGDGTLGGLISLVPHFNDVLESALRSVHSCSNDPLCSEISYNRLYRNGAACYSCLFTSETSCEFGNSHLDRNLLRRNL